MIDDLILAEQLLKKSVMPDRYRVAVIGYYFEGKTYKEVGEDLGCGAQRATQIIRSAIMRIKKKFDVLPVRYKWLNKIPQAPKEERISREEYYRLLKLEEL